MKTKRKKWSMPPWMESYRPLINEPDRVEEFMNCDGVNCNVLVNSPRALICCQVTAQVGILLKLYKAGVIRVCRECGCTELRGCGEGCSWVKPDLCCNCA